MLYATSLFGSVMVMPFQMEAPMSEVLEWRTEVQIARDGSELRKRFRRNPRQRIAGDAPIRFADSTRAVNDAYGGMALRWGAPLWQDSQYVGTIPVASAQILCDPQNVDLRPNSLALLWKGPTEHLVVEIDEVLSDRVTLLAPTSVEVTNAALVPLRVGKVLTNINRDTTGYSSKFKLTYDVDDNLDIAPDAPEQFLGEDIYFDPHLLVDGWINEDFQTFRDVVDFETGLVDSFAPWLRNRVSRSYQVICEDRAACWSFRQWLHRRAGRWRAFWTPTFEADLRPVDMGVITDTMVIQDQGFSALGVPRLHIAVEDSSGNWYPRTITNYVEGSGTVALTLSADLGLPASSIRRVSHLGLKRLDTDRIDLRWIGNNVCQTSLKIMELAP